MFSIDEYLNKDFNDEVIQKTITIHGSQTDVRYRLLDGIDSMELTTKSRVGEMAALILGLTVYDGETQQTIGYEKGKLFINLYPKIASDLAEEIYNGSSKRLKLEEKIIEDEVKNLGETSISDSTEDTVSDTDSIQK